MVRVKGKAPHELGLRSPHYPVVARLKVLLLRIYMHLNLLCKVTIPSKYLAQAGLLSEAVHNHDIIELFIRTDCHGVSLCAP